jgi:hypothetical protein
VDVLFQEHVSCNNDVAHELQTIEQMMIKKSMFKGLMCPRGGGDDGKKKKHEPPVTVFQHWRT